MTKPSKSFKPSIQTDIKVHNAFGTTLTFCMSQLTYAAYDPVFFLHHGYVDYQYAYWQELQKLRNCSQLAVEPRREMPPFSNYTETESVNVNPIEATYTNDRQEDGLDYEDKFNFRYDSLTFNGLSPAEFHQNYNEQCLNKFHVGYIIKDISIVSYNKIFANYENQEYYVESFATIGGPQSVSPHLMVDVTDFYVENNIDNEERKKIHYSVKSYYGEEEIEDNSFKPINEYYDETEQRIVTVHVDHFSDYSPNIIINHLKNTVQFVNADGTYATGVTDEKVTKNF